MSLRLAQDPDADALLEADPFALLTGMLLDQQIPMERAFAGPATIARRLGVAHLDPAEIAAMGEEQFAASLSEQPAVHRFPGSMAARVQALARTIVTEYDGDAAAVWTTASSGADLVARLAALPGYGQQKAQIFTALLGKQLAVRPDGWREAAGAYGQEGSRRSIADVTGPESLNDVRAFKKAVKAAAKAHG
ncbi:MAG: HhH-GPD-type base excision DNA repair protein [Jiangellales bacterium]